MTDFSPLEGAVIAFSVAAGECGPSSFGAADVLRVNMETPEVIGEACSNSIH